MTLARRRRYPKQPKLQLPQSVRPKKDGGSGCLFGALLLPAVAGTAVAVLMTLAHSCWSRSPQRPART
jgi:hypothetical protein